MRRLALAVVLLASCGGGGDVDEDTGVDTGVADTPAEGDVAGEDVVDGGPCSVDEDCDDGDPCTEDTCDTSLGECEHGDIDADGDGYAAMRVGSQECGGTDCDDGDGDAFPGSTDIECGSDQNCDTVLDEIDDRDGDGHLTDVCAGDDCDDEDGSAFPGSTAVDCSEADHDCNGHADRDNDGDGHVRAGDCYGDDCDDEAYTVNPGETEVDCDGFDTDCDGRMSTTEDYDGDGYANETCVAVGREADCDDEDDNIHPGAVELCDMIDQDCDGSWADGGADTDGDTVLDWRCGGPDCDDDDPTIHPGATEVCVDGLDQDCDTVVDGPMRLPSRTYVYDGESHAYTTSIVWSGSQWGLAWEDETYVFYDIYFARLDTDGALVGSVLDVTDTVTSMSESPALTWTGSEFVVAWRDNRLTDTDVFIARISATGALASSEIQVTGGTTSCHVPDIAWSGSELGLVWGDDQWDYYYDLAFQRIAADGTPIGSPTRLTSTGNWSYYPAIAWSGSQYGLAWRDDRDGNRDVWFAVLDPTGAKVVSDTKIETSSGYAYYPDVVWAGSRWALTWQDGRHGQWEIYMELVDTAGTRIGSEIRVTNDPAVSETPRIAWGGSQFAITWSDDRATDYHAYVTLLDASGVKTSSDIQLTLPGADCYGPGVDWSGSAFGMSWYDNHYLLEGIYHDEIAFCD